MRGPTASGTKRSAFDAAHQIPSVKPSTSMATVRRAWNFNINWIGHMNAILWASGILTLLALAALGRLGLQMGTDFAGGYEMQVHFPHAVLESDIRSVLEPLKLEDARVQRFGREEDNDFLILVRKGTGALDVAKQREVRAAVHKLTATDNGLSDLSFAESGERITISFNEPVATDRVQEAVAACGVPVVAVRRGEREDRPEFVVTVRSLADDIEHALRSGLNLPADATLMQRIEFVGPQVGADLRTEGILAVVWSLALILLYVALRFDMYFAPGAIVATVHDLILTLGLFALLRMDFNLTVVAAVLTLIGFSLNDTIVVYDRIRENVAARPKADLKSTVNDSINETLSRTILTSGTVLLVSLSLLLLGGPSLRGFSAVMFIGVAVGTYSSIAVASPVYIALRGWGERGRTSVR